MRKIIIAVLFSILILAINFNSAVERAGDHSKERERNYWVLIVVLLFYPGMEEDGFQEIQKEQESLANQLINTAKNLDSANTKILVGKNATTGNILDALDWIRINAKEGDRVLIIFSGHGCEVYDIDGEKEAFATWDDAITDDELGEKLDNISSKGIDGMCVVLDFCLSGGFVEKSTSFGKVYNQVKSAKNFIDRFVYDISTPSAKDVSAKGNRVIITSTIGSNIGLAGFTNCLLRALKGESKSDKNDNGWVSAEEAFKWARQKYLADFYLKCVEDIEDKPILLRPLFTLLMIILIILLEICCKHLFGEFIIPIPVMSDNYPGELELVQLK